MIRVTVGAARHLPEAEHFKSELGHVSVLTLDDAGRHVPAHLVARDGLRRCVVVGARYGDTGEWRTCSFVDAGGACRAQHRVLRLPPIDTHGLTRPVWRFQHAAGTTGAAVVAGSASAGAGSAQTTSSSTRWVRSMPARSRACSSDCIEAGVPGERAEEEVGPRPCPSKQDPSRAPSESRRSLTSR